MREFSWGKFTGPFLDELAGWIGGRRVLEVFAGNGLLASKLSDRGVDILATSEFTGHDGHENGMFHAVEKAEAEQAVATYGRERDILLMSWPVVSEAALRASLRWGTDRPIVYIGETTDLAKGQLGGCASDLFFELTREVSRFGSYETGNPFEVAAVRMTLPTAAKRWTEERAKGPGHSLFGMR